MLSESNVTNCSVSHKQMLICRLKASPVRARGGGGCCERVWKGVRNSQQSNSCWIAGSVPPDWHIKLLQHGQSPPRPDITLGWELPLSAAAASNPGMLFEHTLCFCRLFLTYSFVLEPLGVTWIKALGLSLIVASSRCAIRMSWIKAAPCTWRVLRATFACLCFHVWEGSSFHFLSTTPFLPII